MIIKSPPLSEKEEEEIQTLMRFRNMDRETAEKRVRRKANKLGQRNQVSYKDYMRNYKAEELLEDASRPVVLTKWQEILKKKKKPFKGYNKKIHARTGGLSAKGRAKFKREQGSNLKPPVTTKPSKLKRGSKAAKRRKSFCARSRGFKRDDGTYSEKAKAARRRWNC